MAKLTRRSLLRYSFGLAAGGTVARPYIANAAAKTATVEIRISKVSLP